MTDKNLNEMIFVLDMSGSMWNLTQDTIGGFNTIIEDQKKVDKEKGKRTKVTTILFDDKYEVLHDGVALEDMKPLTDKEYSPRGSTALLDAMGKAMQTVGKRLKTTTEEERPGMVTMFVVTDGGENASSEFSNSQIKDMVKHQEDKYSWVFSFIGANQDSFGVAGNLGFSAHSIANYTPNKRGTRGVYGAVSARLSSMKSMDLAEGQCYPEQVMFCASMQEEVRAATDSEDNAETTDQTE